MLTDSKIHKKKLLVLEKLKKMEVPAKEEKIVSSARERKERINETQERKLHEKLEIPSHLIKGGGNPQYD